MALAPETGSAARQINRTVQRCRTAVDPRPLRLRSRAQTVDGWGKLQGLRVRPTEDMLGLPLASASSPEPNPSIVLSAKLRTIRSE